MSDEKKTESEARGQYARSGVFPYGLVIFRFRLAGLQTIAYCVSSAKFASDARKRLPGRKWPPDAALSG